MSRERLGRAIAPAQSIALAARRTALGLLLDGRAARTGLVVNAGSGWWAGLVAFVITAILTGFAAYRSDPRRQH
jgi:hypothetical protein